MTPYRSFTLVLVSFKLQHCYLLENNGSKETGNFDQKLDTKFIGKADVKQFYIAEFPFETLV